MVEPEEIRLYNRLEDLPPALWEDLAAAPPDRVRSNAGVRFEDGVYTAPFLGVDHRVDPAGRTITVPEGAHPPGFQAGLVLLNYLAHADEAGLSGQMVPGRSLRGGEMFFKGPHALNTAPPAKRFGRDAAGFLAAGARLGGTPMPSGDAAFRLLALPKILLAYTLHLEDDEFPAEVTVTFDARTDRHLPLDSIWALVNVVSSRLVG